MKLRLDVGEKGGAALDGLSPELVGRLDPEAAVDMGAKPRRDVCRLVHTEACGFVLLELVAVGLDGCEGSEEGEEVFI